ncbi:MAG: hypothetical protein QM692_02770 [Thermomicrobiales bacterium]
MENDTPLTTRENDADLRRQVQQLQERLAFYERFDALIQDNVSHARELLRLAAQERSAGADASPAVGEASHVRSELEAISLELGAMAGSLDALSQRVNAALERVTLPDATPVWQPQRAAIVVHGVASARSALSLQRFLHTLPQVNGVTAREFAGGVLRLDADLAQPLQIDQFHAWDQDRQIQVLSHRPDVLEVALSEPQTPVRMTG